LQQGQVGGLAQARPHQQLPHAVKRQSAHPARNEAKSTEQLS
jgi:hypothetical protein